jgi:dipeptidyl aminopeptidase/acylaminoacyl peptidase
VFAHSGALHALRFDLKRLEPIGGAYSVLDDVAEARGTGAVYFRAGGDGSLFFVPGRNEHALVRVDRAGRITPLTDRRAGYRGPAVSPDGRRIAVVIDPPDEGLSDIWMLDLDRGTFSPFTRERHNLAPRWSADGRSVIWSRSREGGGGMGVAWRSVDGAGALAELPKPGAAQYPQSVSPDGRFVVFGDAAATPAGNFDLWAYPLSGGDAFPLLQSPFNEIRGDIAPNGRWLAYESDESGRPEVYVRGFPEGSRRWAVSTRGGVDPRWSHDGKELFYMEGRWMMAASVNTEGDFSAAQPVALFEWRDMLAGDADYDLLGDGFVMVRRDPLAQFSEFRVIQNWTAGLERLAP